MGQERAVYIPTEIGMQIDKFLAENFAYVIDKGFTANMEADLDRIADGTKKKTDVISSFWKPFYGDLSKFDKVAKSNVVKIENESKTVTVKGKQYAITVNRFGPTIQYEDNGKKYIDIERKDG